MAQSWAPAPPAPQRPAPAPLPSFEQPTDPRRRRRRALAAATGAAAAGGADGRAAAPSPTVSHAAPAAAAAAAAEEPSPSSGSGQPASQPQSLTLEGWGGGPEQAAGAPLQRLASSLPSLLDGEAVLSFAEWEDAQAHAQAPPSCGPARGPARPLPAAGTECWRGEVDWPQPTRPGLQAAAAAWVRPPPRWLARLRVPPCLHVHSTISEPELLAWLRGLGCSGRRVHWLRLEGADAAAAAALLAAPDLAAGKVGLCRCGRRGELLPDEARCWAPEAGGSTTGWLLYVALPTPQMRAFLDMNEAEAAAAAGALLLLALPAWWGALKT